MISVLITCALCLDEWLGEIKKYHPLVLFGRYANWIEQCLYPKQRHSHRQTGSWINSPFIRGILAWCFSVLPIVVLFFVIHILLMEYTHVLVQGVFNVLFLYFTIGQKSLRQHAQAVSKPLMTRDLDQARKAVSMIVSRDTQVLTEQQLATATIETVTENTHDAIIGPLVFFVVFGIPGAILFRLSNTLDAMWGYKTEQYEQFGKLSARTDDALGYIPARITALLMVLVKPMNARSTIKSIWLTGRQWYSPNAGIVMAAGAGALGVKLGGDAMYQGLNKVRLKLGYGSPAEVKDIGGSIQLMYLCSGLFVLIIAVIELSL